MTSWRKSLPLIAAAGLLATGTLPIDQPSVPQRVQPAFPIPQAEVDARR
jgi:hypothetical protein